jgi:hypothetical protein
MDIAIIEAFKLLRHYGIRVARSKVVDSPEDAIAFAERRTAKDPRFMPIVLRRITPGAQSGNAHLAVAASALQTEDAIRQAYINFAGAGTDGEILAQALTVPGTDITIAGRTEEDLGKVIAVSSATHSVEHMIPLGPAGAELLALNAQAFHHHGSRETAHRMLEHLLMRVSALFEETPVTAFRLAVRLHENSYTVLDASMTSPKTLHIKERLNRHAQDKRGEGYHPSGPQ